jgi:hypothetical protein
LFCLCGVFSHDFFEVEAGVLAYPDEATQGGGASGGQSLSVKVYGLDVTSHYLCRFVSISVSPPLFLREPIVYEMNQVNDLSPSSSLC